MNPNVHRRIRLLVVDDSSLVRRIVRESLAGEPDIEVVGTAGDPYEARDRILELQPDVVTLDINMPRMDGLTFLRLLMKHRPTPVVVMSSHTGAATAIALEALEAGAVDFIGKPNGSFSAHEDGHLLATKIRAAAQARLRPPRESSGPQAPEVRRAPAPTVPSAPPAPSPSAAGPRSAPVPAAPPAATPIRRHVLPAPPPPKPPRRTEAPGTRDVILIGSSTGGTEALREILVHLPPDLPGICIVQHIPARFSAALAARLDSLSRLHVKEAENGDRVLPGTALVAPGGHHMTLRWRGDHHVVELNDGPFVHHQRPAVDILFESCVRAGSAGEALAVLLTGMGVDGALGLKRLREAGARTVAQDEESCAVFGMPRAAIEAGAVQDVLPLDRIADRIVREWHRVPQPA